MANNDQVILDQVLEQQRSARAPTMSKADFFEAFCAEQIVKDFDLSDEEITSGLVGNGGDGGIDSVYVFANGDLVHEDFDTSALKKSIKLEVVIVQAKMAASFEEGVIHKFIATVGDVLDFTKPIESFTSVYSANLLGQIELFRNVYTRLASRFPGLSFRFAYSSRGDSSAVHPNVVRKVETLERTIKSYFSNAEFSFDFLGAADLLMLARKQPITSFALKVDKTLNAKGGYVGLVKLRSFFEFVKDEKQQLRKSIFEANVRDYQGTTQVNEEIQASLVNKAASEDFWWLNNGVTIIATKAVLASETLTIEDPQIVNGLQTSSEVFNYFSTANTEGDERSILVRVVEAGTPDTRDRIIKATNSQTAIPPASLRATDKVHRDIEEFLKPHGLYYDRRKNSHKNEGRPIEHIIGISLMAQAVMAVALQRPDDARARPSSLIKKDEDYSRLFSANYPIQLYFVAAKLVKRTQDRLRQRADLGSRDKNNLLFYAAMHAAADLAGSGNPTIEQIAAIAIDSITNEALDGSINLVSAIYKDLGATDQVAKGSAMTARLKAILLKH